MSASFLATKDLIELLVGERAANSSIEIAMKKLKIDSHDVMWEEVNESLYVCETCGIWELYSLVMMDETKCSGCI